MALQAMHDQGPSPLLLTWPQLPQTPCSHQNAPGRGQPHKLYMFFPFAQDTLSCDIQVACPLIYFWCLSDAVLPQRLARAVLYKRAALSYPTRLPQ